MGKLEPDTAAQDYAWGKLQNRQVKEKGYVPRGSDLGRGFDLAEMLELGMGPGLTSSFVEPAAEEQRLTVLCEGKHYNLTDSNGKVLLTAKPFESGFDLFLPSSEAPTFLLRSNQRLESWLLTSVRCEHCEARGARQCGTRELCRMSHYTELVGDGNAFCMDVEIPELREDGQSHAVCSVCGKDDVGGCILSTRRPKWNSRQKTLTLDFRGRCSMASAKNFQLEAENDSTKVVLLFGKVGANKFVLDYGNPLGTVQAFAAALTATHWK
eukprot:symbB.v1.2.026123.t1/scaffold2587.1/size76604/5